jgi:class 3 adenylate cyclase
MAQAIPGAQLREVHGGHVPWSLPDEELSDAIEEFLTGAAPRRPASRRLATVLFTDIVDSTRRASSLGDHSWRELLDRHDETVRGELRRHAGREVKTTGDGFLAAFESPVDAIDCARAVCRGAQRIGVDVRAGIHTGQCEVRGDDLGGIAVHIGARVASLAGPGEVLVSRTVRDLVAGGDITFEARGEHELKGVPDRWQVFAVGANG